MTQLLIIKDELEIYFHRFEEFFKTLKFQIKNKSDFSASINFAFPKRDMLLEISNQNHLPWDTSLRDIVKVDNSISGKISSFQGEIGSWGSSIHLGSDINDQVNSRKSIYSFAPSPICKIDMKEIIVSNNTWVSARSNPA